MDDQVAMTYEQWKAEAIRRFGEDPMAWRFRCPVCGHEASVRDYRDAGASEGAVGFSCIGRWVEGSRSALRGSGSGPCDYAGGGLFRLNPVTVTKDGKPFDTFRFAGPRFHLTFDVLGTVDAEQLDRKLLEADTVDQAFELARLAGLEPGSALRLYDNGAMLEEYSSLPPRPEHACACGAPLPMHLFEIDDGRLLHHCSCGRQYRLIDGAVRQVEQAGGPHALSVS